jgi:hypothetical protein
MKRSLLGRFWSAIVLWPWQYGRCREMDSRRHRLTGEVQFHRSLHGDWLTFDAFWWKEFKPN